MNYMNLNFDCIVGLSLLFIGCLTVTIICIISGVYKDYDVELEKFAKKLTIAVWILFILLVIIQIATGGFIL